MIEKHFPNWDYYVVQELEELCRTLPVLSPERANAFFKEANQATRSDAKVVDRQSGRLFEGMMGFVGASDRKDFSATCDDGNSETFGHGVLTVETYDKSIGVTFCLARVSEDIFLTCGWIGEEKRQGVKNLQSKPYSSASKKWWKIWK
ncbi:MAG: hypothetical protein ABSF37_05445 [Sedimentisphaerales bacterium]|jgi:hypothetical protein